MIIGIIVTPDMLGTEKSESTGCEHPGCPLVLGRHKFCPECGKSASETFEGRKTIQLKSPFDTLVELDPDAEDIDIEEALEFWCCSETECGELYFAEGLVDDSKVCMLGNVFEYGFPVEELLQHIRETESILLSMGLGGYHVFVAPHAD